MKTKMVALKIISYIGLALTLLPSFLVFSGMLALATYKTLMLVGTGCWLISAPFWINGSSWADKEQ